MRITKYAVENPNILIKESSTNYHVEGGLDTPGGVVDMLNDVFRLNKKAEEFLYMIALNAKMRPIGVFEVTHGTVNASYITPREIFLRALLCGATGIIIAHNHPSGECDPSKEDMEVTKKVKAAGEIMNVKLLDHVIIADDTYFSFYKHELL